MDPLAIANLGLGWLGQGRITSFLDGTKTAERVKDAFDGIRDAVLEDRDWTFATSRLVLNRDAAPPAWGYSARFLLPPEVIRVITAKEPGGSLDAFAAAMQPDDGGGLMWELEGRHVVASTPALTLHAKAVVRVEDSELWSPGFCQALAARLASDLCVAITGSRALLGDMEALYTKKLEAAAGNDGRQGRSVRLRANALAARRR